MTLYCNFIIIHQYFIIIHEVLWNSCCGKVEFHNGEHCAYTHGIFVCKLYLAKRCLICRILLD